MCGGSKARSNASATERWLKKNPKASSNFSDVRGIGDKLNASSRILQREGRLGTKSRSSNRSSSRRSSGSSNRSSSRRSSGSSNRSSSKTKTGIRTKVKRAASRVVNRVKSATSRNKSSSTTKIPSVRQAKAASRKAVNSQRGTVKTRPTIRQMSQRSFASQFSR